MRSGPGSARNGSPSRSMLTNYKSEDLASSEAFLDDRRAACCVQHSFPQKNPEFGVKNDSFII
jgi:hypothetical protein